MGLGQLFGTIAGVAGAPFTGGASLALPAILGGASALAGGLSNSKAARTSTASSAYGTADQGLADHLRQMALSRLGSSVDMGGFAANGVSNINQAFAPIQQSINADLTTRGLASSPVAGAATSALQMARGGGIANFLNTIPLLQRQFANEDFSQANSFLNAQPKTITSVGPGSAAGGALGSAAGMLAFLAGQGLLSGDKGTKTSSQGNV